MLQFKFTGSEADLDGKFRDVLAAQEQSRVFLPLADVGSFKAEIQPDGKKPGGYFIGRLREVDGTTYLRGDFTKKENDSPFVKQKKTLGERLGIGKKQQQATENEFLSLLREQVGCAATESGDEAAFENAFRKTVVITGSARGLGFELAKNFRANDFNVMLSDVNEATLAEAVKTLSSLPGKGKVECTVCDVTDRAAVEKLAETTVEAFGQIDFWINNAGVNQSERYAWDVSDKEIDFLLNVDLRGAIYGSTTAVKQMREQGFGAIYNVEGFGSNDAYQPYLVMYGTAKRAVTYFSGALANELKETGAPVIVGKLSPGIMITDFLTSSEGKDGNNQLSERVKKVYNILGDYPDVIAAHLVKGMLKNKKNDKRIEWLTGGKAFCRFMKAPFSKRDFFAEKK